MGWTYTTLQEKIAGTLNKTNLTAVIPDFITQGESVLTRRLKARQQQSSITLTLSDESVGVPSGLMTVLSFALTDPVESLEYVSPEAFDALDLTAGVPRFYTLTGNEILLAPIPDAEYEAQLRYRSRLVALSSSVRSNWLLDQHPDAYLYAALCESAPYLRDDERLPMWQARRDTIIAEINATQPRRPSRLRLADVPSRRSTFDIVRG